MQKNALQVAQNYEREAKERLRRISLAAAGLDVVGAKKATAAVAAGSSLDEAWYDENTQSPSQNVGAEVVG
jgi:COP9 signalosome complex subunit 1